MGFEPTTEKVKKPTLVDELKKWLNDANPQEKSAFIAQIKNEKTLADAFRKSGLSTEDLSGRAREIPQGVLSKIMKVDLVDLITEITTLKLINTVELINAITNVGTLNLLNTVNLVKSISSIDAITNIANLASVDLIDAITEVSLVDLISEVALIDAINEIVNVSSVDLIDNITNLGTLNLLNTVNLIKSISSIDSITNLGTLNLLNTLNLVKEISSITNITNIQSVDLIDEIAAITNILNIENIESIEKVRGLNWFDRNAEINLDYYSAENVPHVDTSRWSYTVPANHIAMVEVLDAEIVRTGDATTADYAACEIKVNKNGEDARVILNAFITTNNIGDRSSKSIGSTMTLFAGDKIEGLTVDLSNGGRCRQFLSYKLTEFDV